MLERCLAWLPQWQLRWTAPFSLATTGQTSSGISCWWVREETWKSPSLHTEHLRRYNLVSPVVTSPRVCCAGHVCAALQLSGKMTVQGGWPTATCWLLQFPVITQQPDAAALDASSCSDAPPSNRAPWDPCSQSTFFPFPVFFLSPSDPDLCEVQSWVCVYVARPLPSWLNLPPFHIPSWILPMAPKPHLWFPFGRGQQAQWGEGQSHPEELHLYSSLFCTSPSWLKAHDS